MSIRNKILLPLIGLLTVLLAVFIYRIVVLNVHIGNIEKKIVTTQKINDLTNRMGLIRQDTRQSVIAYYALREDRYLMNIERNHVELLALIEDIRPLMDSERGRQLLNNFENSYIEVRAEREKVVETLRSGNTASNTKAFKSWEVKAENNYAALLDLASYNLHSLERNNLEYIDLVYSILVTWLIMLGVTLLLIVGFYFYLQRIIIDPIQELSVFALKISKGNFDTKIRLQSNDEIGTLGNNLADMSANLKKYYESLQKDVEKKDEELRINKALETQKDEFISIASHELKTPITSLKAYTQLLRSLHKRKGDESYETFLLKMEEQVNRLTDLIADLLDVTKIQSGKLMLRPENFDLCELINEVTAEIQHTTNHKIIAKLTKIKPIYADRNRIRQVIANLLTNAIKYSPETSLIVVSAKPGRHGVSISVKDEGIGIPEEKKDHVFERFYRVHEDKGNTYPGLGLGLYISKEIVTRHRGKIWVESKEHQGSTFSFILPYKEEIS